MVDGDSVLTPSQPVSLALERELRSKLGRGMQIWLDRDGTYSQFVDQLQQAAVEGRFAPVVSYRGSFLRMLMALEGVAETVADAGVLIHLPGFSPDDVRDSPVLAYYKAGSRYQVNLKTLVENAAAGRIEPDEIARYTGEELGSLEDADVWLSKQLAQNGDVLPNLELHWIWERLADGSDDLPGPEECLAHLRTVVSLDLEKTGLKSLYEGAQTRVEKLRTLGDALAGWSMAIEYVSDLKRDPIDPDIAGLRPPTLNKVYQDAALKLVRYLRANHPEDYIRIATDFENRISAERDGGQASDLGRIDTFLFEDDRMMLESLARLTALNTESVLEWSELRKPDKSIWLRTSSRRAAVWTLVRVTAALLDAIAEHPASLAEAFSVDDALLLYRDNFWKVDAAHREFEQQLKRLRQPQLPHFGEVRHMLDVARGQYHAWADRLAREFAKLCEKENRFIPSKGRQQRMLFEQVVLDMKRPNDRIAYLLLDGFRFEMAHELLARLKDGTNFKSLLDARMTELPSVTAVGMNALAPVANHGRLTPVIKSKDDAIVGFRSSTFDVTSPEHRRTAIYRRFGQQTCPFFRLHQVIEHKNLKGSLAGEGIAIVHSLDLDEAGEVGQGTVAFDNILMQIASAIRQLREAGVSRFVITADHGFLLEPPNEGLDVLPSPSGARYHYSKAQVNTAETVCVSFADLAYDGAEGYVVLPRGIDCFRRGVGNYVHGGNSLQERVIPVLRLDYPQPKGGSDEVFKLVASKGARPDPAANLVKLQLQRSNTALAFVQDEVELTFTPTDPALSLEVVSIGPSGDLSTESSILTQVGAHYEVDFVITGPVDGRTKVQIHAPGRAGQVEPVELAEFFTVLGREPASAASTKSADGTDWSVIGDEAAVGVLKHIEAHGSMTEAEVTKMLGSARLARRFARKITEWQQYLSFEVRVATTPSGKLYEKE